MFVFMNYILPIYVTILVFWEFIGVMAYSVSHEYKEGARMIITGPVWPLVAIYGIGKGINLLWKDAEFNAHS